MGQTIIWDRTTVVTMDGSAPHSNGTTVYREFDPSGGIGPAPPPGVRHFLRGYVMAPSPSVIEPTSLTAESLPVARSLLEVGEERGRLVVEVFCDHSHDQGHASARALATVTDTERFGLVFRAILDGFRDMPASTYREVIGEARDRRDGARVRRPFEEHVVVLLEHPVLLGVEQVVTDGCPPRVECPSGVTELDPDALRLAGIRGRLSKQR